MEVREMIWECCEGAGVTREMREVHFGYGTENPATLVAHHAVYTCDGCGVQFYDSEGEMARERAVQKHLGRSMQVISALMDSIDQELDKPEPDTTRIRLYTQQVRKGLPR